MSKLYWAKVKEDAIIPTKRDEDAGYDLYPCFKEDYLEIKPLHTRLVPLGVATAFDASYVMILKERGSTGTKGIAQRSGVIDSGYRGEYMAPVTNVMINRFVSLKKRHWNHGANRKKKSILFILMKRLCARACFCRCHNWKVKNFLMKNCRRWSLSECRAY